jgi:isoamylase
MSKAFKFEILSGDAASLGANADREGVNFALFSAHAERVELCLYDPSGKVEIARLILPEYTNEIWHGYVPGLKPGALRLSRPWSLRPGKRPSVQSRQAVDRPLCPGACR